MRLRRRRLSTVRTRPRDSLLRALRVDLIIVLLLVLVGLGYYLHHNPIRLGADYPAGGAGEPATGQTEGDVLLLLPAPRPESRADTLESLDFAANWVNILGQEVGPLRLSRVSELIPPTLDRVALLVVPRSVAREMSGGQVATISQFVESGGHLLVELPFAAWAPLVGVLGEPAELRASRRITAFDGAVVRGDLRDDVIQSPLPSLLSPVAMTEVSAVPGADVLMEVDGLPAFVRYRHGQGWVYVLYFELARAVGSIQQGVPTADWEVARPPAGLPEGFTRTPALIADGRLRRTGIPSADLLERQVLNTVTTDRPLPRVWTFPGRRPAALVMTHSGFPDVQSGRYLLEWEQGAELPATLFADAADLRQEGEPPASDLGVLLVPPELASAPARPTGVLGFNPLERPLDWEAQVRELSRLREGRPRLSRVAEGLWRPDFGETFRLLAGLGIDADSSYGPAFAATESEAADGYSFGTGLPFRPLDRYGLLLPIWEVPVVLHDGLALEPAWSENLLERAGRTYHQAVVADWRTGTMVNAPRAAVVSTWRRLYEMARARGYWVTDLSTLVAFWDLREEVRLRSEFNPAERRLSVWAEVPELERPGGETLVPGLAFEARFEDRPVERITRNGEDVPFVELGHTADGVFHLYAVPPGASRIEITYQGPILLEEPP